MRKEIFIIHGIGVKDGIGREIGGDLDTIGSNVFYSVWAQNFLREELKREPVLGEDYDFDFLNYSEGLYHLTAHRGCDIYIPDFPVDALAPRLNLTRIKDDAAVEIINEFTKALGDFKTWIVSNAPAIDAVYKRIFNEIFSQAAKITAHQEVPALKIALNVLKIMRILTEVSLSQRDWGKEKEEEFLKNILRCISGEEFYGAKKKILSLMGNNIKYDMSEIVEKKEDILAFDEAHTRDMTTRGRTGYTGEFMVVAVETAAYIARGFEELRRLPFDAQHRCRFSKILNALTGELKNLFRQIESVLSGAGIKAGGEGLGKVLSIIGDSIAITDGIVYPVRSRSSKDDRTSPPTAGSTSNGVKKYADGFQITMMLTMEATGMVVPEIEIVFERIKGAGRIFDMAGNEIGTRRAVVKTDVSGSAKILYRPLARDEKFQFGVTYDGLRLLLVPDDIEGNKEAEKINPEPERARAVMLELLVRMFRNLRDNDVNVVSIDDHHPYTAEVLSLLNRLQKEGILGRVQVHAKSRGMPEKDEEKKCGADLIYEEKIQGKPWDNEGLQYLKSMAHVQDLHLGCIPLAIELSKLIGSSFGKIEMVKELSKIKNREMLENIMQTTGWDKKVKKYEEGLAAVLPRTETNMAKISFIRKPDNGRYEARLLLKDKIKKLFSTPKEPSAREPFLRRLYSNNPANRLQVMAVLSPFTNPKKGETKINVASALNYLLRDRKYYADYFFYCYGSEILTTRKPNDRDKALDLSELMQCIGTPADGGHSGAATCSPSSNPAFPRKRFLKVNDRNFFEFLYYVGKKLEEYTGGGIELLTIKPVKVKKYKGTYEKFLSKIKRNVIEYVFERSGAGERINPAPFRPGSWPERKRGGVKVILAKMSVMSRDGSEERAGITQVIEYIGRKYKPDYIFLLMGGLRGMVLYNFNDLNGHLDLPEMARRIGWDEDGGHRMIAIATPRRNRRIPKDFRRRGGPDFIKLARIFAGFINEGQNIWRITEVKQISQ